MKLISFSISINLPQVLLFYEKDKRQSERVREQGWEREKDRRKTTLKILTYFKISDLAILFHNIGFYIKSI